MNDNLFENQVKTDKLYCSKCDDKKDCYKTVEGNYACSSCFSFAYVNMRKM